MTLMIPTIPMMIQTARGPRTAPMFAAIAALGLAGVCAGPCAGDEITVEPVADNTLYESPSGTLSAGAGQWFFCGVDAGGSIKRAVMRFDVSAIPPGSMVTEVELSLTMDRAITGPNTVNLHRAEQAWGEGTSVGGGLGGGAGGPATTGDATWLHTFFPTEFWVSEGGDFDPDASGSTEVAQTLAVYTWDGAGLVADVQGWVDDAGSNFGWLMKHENEAALASAKRFVSREGPAGARPSLRIVYEAAGVCPADCDETGMLDFFDFLCFQNLFATGDPKADCDGTGTLDFFDFLCFQNDFARGCP